jgi:cardiolipin synthase (CMP-forming)
MPVWLPNALTISRLLLVPVVIWAILAGRHGMALGLFAAAALTDFLDGAAARRFRLTSQSGAYLDPIADKFLLSGVFLALAIARLAPWWLVALIFGRDLYILVAAGSLLWLTSLRKFSPSRWGKASTFVQIVTAVIWMARNMLEVPVLNLLSALVVWPCAALTIWSGVHYTWRGFRSARAH